MPPKIRITKKDILDKAVELVREKGDAALNSRALAKELKCSTQPIFSNYATMDELRREVISYADTLYKSYVERQIKSGKYPMYKAQGMGYICFAKEEKELFKLLYMRDRSEERKDEEAFSPLIKMLQDYIGLSEKETKLFHLEMWVSVHGIAVMLASSYLDLEDELISDMLTDNFEGLKYRFGVSK